MKKNLFLLCLSLALSSTIASCGGGGGGSSTATKQSVSDYNSDFLFGSPTGGIVRFYSGNQLIATFRYEDAYIDGNKSTSASVYATVYAAGDHRNFLNPCVLEETINDDQHNIRILNEQLCVTSLSTFRQQGHPDFNGGTHELSGMGYGDEVVVAFPRGGTDLSYSGDASTGKQHIDEGNIVLYFYKDAIVIPDTPNIDGGGGDVPPNSNIDNAMEMRATYVSVDPK